MLDLNAVLDITEKFATNSSVKMYGRTVYVAFYNSKYLFSCHTDECNIDLKPLSIRLTFQKAVETLRHAKSELCRASITCVTRNNVAGILGTPVCLYSSDFELYGRIRRAAQDRVFNCITGARYVSAAVQSITSIKQCRFCSLHPANKKQCMSEGCRLSAINNGDLV